MPGQIKAGKGKPYMTAAIYGSPRRGGNSALLLDSFLEGMRHGCNSTGKALDIKKIIASELNISPCRECRNCSRTGECVIGDDMLDIYRILIDADFIAVASPVFFTTVSGYLKAIIDRCQRFWSLKYEQNKNIIKKKRRGIFICVAGSGREDIFDCPRKVIRSFFDVLFIDYEADFLYGETDSKGEILKNDTAIKDVYNFGKKIGEGNMEKK
jgi:multimeric flavodoxin WrbA